ncbi:nucleotide exchange factor GrpE [Nakamurella flava]|uniref:nucleotide exchange factor GrpE n=1 Tax=Nakamurella flava TaxID=2576308 RepID=UPI00140A808E|nr:nucleotide exchange factor GrpE [Nakamurella flava]
MSKPDTTPDGPDRDALATQVERAGDRAAAAETQADLARSETVATTERVAALEARIAEADVRSTTVERRLADADEEIERLTARLAEAVDGAAAQRSAVAALHQDVTTLQEAGRRTATDIARAVEQHTTAALVDGQQRLHQASVTLAGLAQSLADAARSVPTELTAESARTLFETFAVDVDLLLQQLGHEALGVAAGDPFDPRRHRAVRRVATDDPAADRTVARVLRDGYRTPATDRVLLFADVEVHRTTPTTDPAAPGQEGTPS